MGAEKNVLGGGGTGFTEEIVSSFYIMVAADDDSTGSSGQHAGVGIGSGEFGEGLGAAGLPEGWAGASRDIVTETGRGGPQKPRDFCRTLSISIM